MNLLALMGLALFLPVAAFGATPSATPLSPAQQAEQILVVSDFDHHEYRDAWPIFMRLAAIGDARSESDLGLRAR